uniref:Membrane protein n=1 Tax=Pantoea phage Survivor TaxID=3232176 RepID=A0AAU8L0J8_9CAUD
MDIKLYNVMLGIILFGVVTIMLGFIDLAYMFQKVKAAGNDQKKVMSAISSFKWQMWTLVGAFVVYSCTVMYRAGIPLW